MALECGVKTKGLASFHTICRVLLHNNEAYNFLLSNHF